MSWTEPVETQEIQGWTEPAETQEIQEHRLILLQTVNCFKFHFKSISISF